MARAAYPTRARVSMHLTRARTTPSTPPYARGLLVRTRTHTHALIYALIHARARAHATARTPARAHVLTHE